MCKILNEQEVKPHKVRYYWNAATRVQREDGGGSVLYREVKIIKETAVASKKKPSDAVAIISYDEKLVSKQSRRPPGPAAEPACMRLRARS